MCLQVRNPFTNLEAFPYGAALIFAYTEWQLIGDMFNIILAVFTS